MAPFAFLIGILSLCIYCIDLGAAAESGYAVVEQLRNVPDGWIKRDAAPASESVRFRLAMIQERAAEFERRVIDMSTPGHSSYGQHMKRDDIREFLRPSEEVSDRVLSWLRSENVPAGSIESHGNWVTFTVPVSQAELRTLAYSVPDDVHRYIQMIQPTTRFGQPVRHERQPLFQGTVASLEELAANCSATITPNCLRELYGIYDTRAEPDPRNRLGVSGFLDQYARYDDFENFMRSYAPNRTDVNFTVVSINDGLNLQDSSLSSIEASLDVQYAYSLAYKALGTYYTTGGRGPVVPEDGQDTNVSTNEPYLDQLHYLLDLSDEKLPAVLSTSYGEDEQSVPESYSNATCNLFAQLGARGVSIIFSSGDSGVGSTCITNDGTNRTRFLPVFPASCPFVTAVGGTYDVQPEKAISFSSGGFSDRFPRPSYQDSSVQGYLEQLGSRWNGLYNPSGRGFPDVAAQATNFVVIDHGQTLRVGGTSASAPVFAAIVSRLNAARLEDGLPKLGFLNPWLYSLNQTGFTDIVDGGSSGCYIGTSNEQLVPNASWNATPGWDPVTGLGTPFYNTLVKLATSVSSIT
ncbi:S53 family peptidase [Aspergillus fischeri NRRL 181]|uniref:tripeptidyl-peptidase II n=1 Tax=Neosartorya fischeri (strain ATCC 1020 / DSM 3700 / CBS 544.65 / FGSC A1164 / JCM 1740 / NRRL 181 / WB 181) TaxID=331117 RepID=A1D7F7_NEOFI|nr:tripeptidyl peptidase SED3 [Aspergillus fischeri NRRL 181]EAW21651.1 tripeptidyl peptidase SED3 [Aspergillus fischeri NRRL 181]